MPTIVKENSTLGGGRHGSSVVNSYPNLLFHYFGQARFLFHFWFHFWMILGTRFATILFFGRPGLGGYWKQV